MSPFTPESAVTYTQQQKFTWHPFFQPVAYKKDLSRVQNGCENMKTWTTNAPNASPLPPKLPASVRIVGFELPICEIGSNLQQSLWEPVRLPVLTCSSVDSECIGRQFSGDKFCSPTSLVFTSATAIAEYEYTDVAVNVTLRTMLWRETVSE